MFTKAPQRHMACIIRLLLADVVLAHELFIFKTSAHVFITLFRMAKGPGERCAIGLSPAYLTPGDPD